jgi:hypothetical protein
MDKIKDGLYKVKQGFEVDDDIKKRLKEMGYA